MTGKAFYEASDLRIQVYPDGDGGEGYYARNWWTIEVTRSVPVPCPYCDTCGCDKCNNNGTVPGEEMSEFTASNKMEAEEIANAVLDAHRDPEHNDMPLATYVGTYAVLAEV